MRGIAVAVLVLGGLPAPQPTFKAAGHRAVVVTNTELVTACENDRLPRAAHAMRCP